MTRWGFTTAMVWLSACASMADPMTSIEPADDVIGFIDCVEIDDVLFCEGRAADEPSPWIEV
jgi:hypothetical protein